MSSFFGERQRYKPPPEPPRKSVIPVAAPTALMPTDPSFKHFTREEELLWQELGKNPTAGWDTNGIPAFTTSYLHLEKLTGEFPDNGQPPEVNQRRIWSTFLIQCEICGGLVAAHWVDRWELIAGYYCDTCHKDYPLTSYLSYELNRKPYDSIVSEHRCYLSENPDFQSFPLWVPGKITYLGSAMGQGKTTAIFRNLAIETPGGAGIVLVPRISLAQALAAEFRYRHGHNTWGLFHEGSGQENRYIGRYGAIGCFSSLSLIVEQAKARNIDDFRIAIDESDFSYKLKALQPAAARQIIQTLSEATKSQGLVVAGQTESLLALESFAYEIGLKARDIRGFYSSAALASGKVKLLCYPRREGYIQAVRLQGAIESITNHLDARRNVYAFFSDRRDVRTLTSLFETCNPVVYSAYTKGERRAKAILKNQSLTDSQLFLATSAACVGINILDENAVTVIVTGHRYGQIPWKEVTQESLRNRERTDVEIHYTNSPPALPVKPSEAESTSLYQESLKDFQRIHPHANEHIVRDYALSTLSNSQSYDYIKHNLQEIAGMRVVQMQGMDFDDKILESLKVQAKDAEAKEKEAIKERAKIYLDRNDILTEYEIRRRSIAGSLDRLSHLAYKKLNKACQAVGWHGERKENKPIELSSKQREHVQALIEDSIDTDALAKRRRGWLSVRFPKLTHLRFSEARQDAIDNDIESAAVDDDRFRGEVLQALLAGLQGEIFTEAELAKRVLQILTAPIPKSKETLLSKLKMGALGTTTHKQVRFFNKDTDASLIVGWVRNFISGWYPALIRKSHDVDQHALNTNYQEQRELFSLWLEHQLGVSASTDEPFLSTLLPDQEVKQQARELRKQGRGIVEIAKETGLSWGTVSKETAGIKETAQHRILKVLGDGQQHEVKDIVAEARIALRTFHIEIKKLPDVQKVSRGVYQKVC